MPELPWIFEECSPEDVCDPTGQPWAHAVRGRKPQRPVVMGYGHTPNAADADARTKATQYDAREMLGERGEVKTKCQNDFGIPVIEAQSCHEPIIIEYIPDDTMIAFMEYRYRGYGWPIMELADSSIVKMSV